VRPERVAETEIAEGTSIVGLFAGQGNELLLHNVHDLPELSICQCDSHIKKVSVDIKPFIPQAPTSCALLFPVVRICLTDDWRPPEAIPCHPDLPG